MPRPKRTRAASARAAPAATEPAPAPAPAPTQPSSDPSTDIYDISDREKEKARRDRDAKAAPAAATTARASLRSNARQAAKQPTRDAALPSLDSAASASVGVPPPPQEESADDVEFGRRAAATPLQSGRMADISGLDLDDSMFDDLNTTINTAGPASAQRSLNTSVLSASHLKRRPRAGSFLSRDDGPIRPGSRAGPTTPGYSTTFNIANFRRRAREPSILGTAQKERAQRPEPDTDLENRTDEEEEEEEEEEDNDEVEAEPLPERERDEMDVFGSEIASTPPPPRRSSRRSRHAVGDEPEPQASGANTRKRKSTEAHPQRPRSSPFRENPMAPDDDDSELSDIASPSHSLPHQLVRPPTPVLDEDAAPPMSSDSSEDDAVVWPPMRSLARGRIRRAPEALRRTPVREVENLSDMSSPPSLTYSPNYDEPSPPPQKATRQTRKVVSKETKLTTADLTSLLPRRRHRPNRAYDSEEEVDTSALGNQEDELSYVDVDSRRQPGGSSSRTGNRKQSATTSRPAQPKRKRLAGSTKPAKRTYGRTSDKENQNGDDDAARPEREVGMENSEETVSQVGEELKNASRKFAEVDKWSLEYEEMAQSSSPRDGR